MKLLNISTLMFISAFGALAAHAAPLTFYTYSVSQSLSCNSVDCPTDANITLQGTITTDGLGALTASNIVVWDLSVTLTGQTPIRLTQSNGQFSTFGSPQILATNSDLTITRNTSTDGFTLSGNANAPASWLYGPSAEILFYNTSPDDQYYAQQVLSTPSTFTAVAVSRAETPEPASLYLTLVATLVLLAFRRQSQPAKIGKSRKV